MVVLGDGVVVLVVLDVLDVLDVGAPVVVVVVVVVGHSPAHAHTASIGPQLSPGAHGSGAGQNPQTASDSHVPLQYPGKLGSIRSLTSIPSMQVQVRFEEADEHGPGVVVVVVVVVVVLVVGGSAVVVVVVVVVVVGGTPQCV